MGAAAASPFDQLKCERLRLARPRAAVDSGMADFDDISIDRSSGPLLQPPSPSGPPLLPIAGVAVLLLAAGALWYFVVRGKTPPPAAAPVAQTTVEVPKK